jgi:two-component system chemotaxis response regulator CheB
MSVAASAEARAQDRYRVLLVDDSAVIRGIIRKVLTTDPEIEIVNSVGDGQRAVEAVKRDAVDVVVLDIEMPVMDGLTALPRLLEVDPTLKIIMASTLTQKNASVSLQALAAGAADYIPKPTAHGAIYTSEDFQRELTAKVKALAEARRRASARVGLARKPSSTDAPAKPAAKYAPTSAAGIPLRKAAMLPPKVLCIGSSTGGPQALMTVIGGLKNGIDLPILITQHMPKTFTGILAEHLKKIWGGPCAEGVDGEPIERGHIYIAPGEHHMEIRGERDKPVIRITDGPPENFCKPAVDPMLRSVVQVYGGHVLTAILTGMGHDGLEGGRTVVDGGGTVIAQDEATSVVWGMPGAVATAGICAAVVPLPAVAGEIKKLCGRKVR